MKNAWMPGLHQRRFWRLYFIVFSLVIGLFEKTYQALESCHFYDPGMSLINLLKASEIDATANFLNEIGPQTDDNRGLILTAIRKC